MPLCDYFSAPDDPAAVALLDTFGGPGPAGFDTVALKGIDPVVVIARLEAVLTGCTYREARARPRSGRSLADPDACDSAFVVALTDTLAEALAALPSDALPHLAERWSAAEELRQSGTDAATAADALHHLAALARRARTTGHRLYCWWSL
ncbi:hypothetical protein HUT16_31565 [Kitasatospora sp. NA04385]|uniref:hypothetical protein n=1 Tax=Kitasatospora sp. NA04385 TaxID=2742135 RepID=UPI0015903D6C|nr:hypothetical protein [Kitasatospora sp. NA04385]QKW23020.1 hypothetical protein HUT16_31565 [Kitasatospora sp. NA04385]